MWSALRQVVISILTLEARAVVARYHPRVVAVTGSVGKTSTKDAVYAVLAARAHVRRSEKSFNSEVGLPLTILGVPNAWSNPLRWVQNLVDGLFLLLFKTRYPEWLVLEVGADRPGDVSRVARWLPVDIAVITRLPEVPVHIEYFASPKEVMEEKASIIRALKPGGALVLYSDEDNVRTLRERAGESTVVTFGLSPEADVRAEQVAVYFAEGGKPRGMEAHLRWGQEQTPLTIRGAVGTHALLPVLAAAAVGKAQGYSIGDVGQALQSYVPPAGRMRLVTGIKDTLVVDDTYNASPAAVLAALETLLLLKGKRSIAVLGDMLELGRHSAVEHRKSGAHAARVCDLLVTVGFRARTIAEGALEAGMPEAAILQFEDARRAGAELQNMLRGGDVVLVKGSQSMRMERTVEEIMAEPERAGELLVRQDAEWKRR